MQRNAISYTSVTHITSPATTLLSCIYKNTAGGLLGYLGYLYIYLHIDGWTGKNEANKPIARYDLSA